MNATGKAMNEPKMEPLAAYRRLDEATMVARSAAYLASMRRRRTVRDYRADAEIGRAHV